MYAGWRRSSDDIGRDMTDKVTHYSRNALLIGCCWPLCISRVPWLSPLLFCNRSFVCELLLVSNLESLWKTGLRVLVLRMTPDRSAEGCIQADSKTDSKSGKSGSGNSRSCAPPQYCGTPFASVDISIRKTIYPPTGTTPFHEFRSGNSSPGECAATLSRIARAFTNEAPPHAPSLPQRRLDIDRSYSTCRTSDCDAMMVWWAAFLPLDEEKKCIHLT